MTYQPTNKDFRALVRKHKLTLYDVANIVGMSYNAVQKWNRLNGDSKRGVNRQAWVLLNLYLGEILLGDFRDMVDGGEWNA